MRILAFGLTSAFSLQHSALIWLMGRVLLINQDPALTGALRASHHLMTHDVETCAGPFEAQRLLRTRAFDVVITDPTTSAKEDLALLA